MSSGVCLGALSAGSVAGAACALLLMICAGQVQAQSNSARPWGHAYYGEPVAQPRPQQQKRYNPWRRLRSTSDGEQTDTQPVFPRREPKIPPSLPEPLEGSGYGGRYAPPQPMLGHEFWVPPYGGGYNYPGYGSGWESPYLQQRPYGGFFPWGYGW